MNRLRRVDRWIMALPAARTPGALVVDLGYGAHATTTLELHARLARITPGIRTIGIEIDPERVARADRERAALAAVTTSRRGFDAEAFDRVSFMRGGFEIPTADRPSVVRALNVLRQYDEHEVAEHWARMRSRLAPGGRIIEGTSNEIGSVASWITLDAEGAQSLTIALKLSALGTDASPSPSVVAERLPKALIHRNVPGEPIHDVMRALDAAWERAAHLSTWSPKQRWISAVAAFAEDWPVLHPARARFGELTLPWDAVAPRPLDRVHA